MKPIGKWRHANQHGFVLISTLMFLIILTIYVVSSARFATLSERIAGNTRSRTVAFYAAQAALDRAYTLLVTRYAGSPVNDNSSSMDTTANQLASVPTSFSNHSGLDAAKKLSCTFNTNTSRCLLSGETLQPSITMSSGGTVSSQPSFIISELAPGTSDSGKKFFVITAKGFGVSSSSVVVLQEIVTAS